MGLVYAEISLTNAGDLELVRRNLLSKNEVKTLKVDAMMDSGAFMLTINELIKEQLGLFVIDKRTAQLADGTLKELEVVVF